MTALDPAGAFASPMRRSRCTIRLSLAIVEPHRSVYFVVDDISAANDEWYATSSQQPDWHRGFGWPGQRHQRQSGWREPHAKVGGLADNGGPTKTHALLTGSPAIDTGSNGQAQAANLTTDQRGFARIFNSTVDIGAFEVQPAFSLAQLCQAARCQRRREQRCAGRLCRPGRCAVDHQLHQRVSSVAVPANAAVGLPFGFLDVTGNNEVTPEDALSVINAINSGVVGEGESMASEEGISGSASQGVQPFSPSSQFSFNDVLGLLAIDAASRPKRRR